MALLLLPPPPLLSFEKKMAEQKVVEQKFELLPLKCVVRSEVAV